MKSKNTTKILTIILIMQWAFVQIIAQYPNFIETYYSNGLYIYVSKALRFVLGWIPFSVGDLLYLFIIGYLIYSIYKTVKNRQFKLKKTIFKVGAMVSVIYFLFNLNWGLNYFREPLFNRLNFEKTNYSNKELLDFTEKLIAKTNQIHLSITKNDTIVDKNPQNKQEIKKMVSLAYSNLQKKHPQFAYKNSSVKSSLLSIPLTYMGFAGYLNPITNEAQVNALIPLNTYPATACHEVAHQLGIASEKEANFVGYLAATNSNNSFFNYSGYLMALRYTLFEVYRKEPTKYEHLKNKLNKGILKDLKNSHDFWISYQNWTEPFFKIFYDSFLKANKQKLGIKGYNKVVLLLINYHLTAQL